MAVVETRHYIHAHHRAILILVRIVVVHVMPRLSWMSRCLRCDRPLDDWLPRLEYVAELWHDTNRNVFKHLLDFFSQVCFRRKAIDAG